MNRETWSQIKHSKFFNVNVYRRGLWALVVSLLFNFISGILLFYIYLTEPERDYYATNGVTPPIKLKSMSAPNLSSNALLPPDPPTELENRLIPE